MKKKLSIEDQALFKKAMKGVKPLTAIKKIQATPPKVPLKIKIRKKMEEPPPQDSFSDHEYLDPAASEDTLYYSRPGLSHQTLRLFKKGAYAIEAVLDLHGMVVDEARVNLHRFLLECQNNQKRLILIIHGKGHLQKKPILKNKVNHWLRESPQVLAFCSAKPKDGGNGALYVYLKRGK